jgi:glycoprotein endo-alpha-1,2-mannosidase
LYFLPVTSSLRRLAVTTLLVLVLAPAAAAARPTVAIFFYPWYGTPARDGGYQMWTQNGHAPPNDLYSRFFPARGAYSSSDPKLLDRQMTEIAAAGVDEVVVSWWGWGSATDKRLPAVLRAARRHGLTVAVHIEPFDNRSAAAVADDVTHLYELGITDVYVFDAEKIPAADWAAVRSQMPPVRLFAQTGHAGFAAAGLFDGIYTYDIVTYPGGKLVRICGQAHKLHLLCAPSVGPGYDAVRADGDLQNKPRRAGATYDAMWTAALESWADVVTITSYNEWGEGTQIEPARATPGYASYEGAWVLHGAAAATAYLDRTAYWAARLHSRP